MALVFDETPSGTLNGSNVSFTLANAPNPGDSLTLYLNGILQLYGMDFTLATNAITYNDAPDADAWHRAYYEY